ncbi:MAG: hypothetical protein J6C81_06365 [Muribaculaceae bacterium]|nr:hypothetical protein [Muribaculaceae bacterium]
MGLNNKTTLKNQADLIRYEDGEGKNTAERVGKVISEIIENTDQSLTTETNERVSQENAIRQSVTIASNTATTAYNEAKDAKTKVAVAQSTANAAQSTADTANATANAALPLSIEFTDLDTLGTDGSVAALRTLLRNTKHTRYKVVSSNFFVGILDIFGDNMNHVLTEVLTTHYNMEDGVIEGNSHQCQNFFQYFRSFNFNSPQLKETEIGKWTPWKTTSMPLGDKTGTAFPGDRGKSVEELAKGVRIFPFDATCYHPSSELSEWPAGTIAFCYDNHLFYQKDEDGTWSQYTPYHTTVNYKTVPRTDCIFRHGNVLYAMQLVEGGDYYIPEEYVIGKSEFDAIRSQVANIAIYPFDGIMPNKTGIQLPKNGIWFRSDGTTGRFSFFGEDSDTNTYIYNENKTIDGEQVLVARSDRMFRCGNELYRYDGKMLVKVGGASVGNNFNVTVEVPLNDGEYYSDIKAETQSHNVLQAVLDAGYAALGLTITFAISSSSWKTYQYIGPNITSTQFLNVDNWIDLAGMSAGAEAIINVDALCPRKVAGYYDKGSAIDAILELQNASGIKYAKIGLVITYRTGEYAWEAYQFTGEVSDFSNKDLWKQFGGGGTVKTSATPEKDGKDAFSTGGAYDMQQNAFDHLDVDQDAENHIIKAINKKGDEMGQSISIPKSTGGGSVSGSSLNIYLENPAVYAAFGSEISVRAAIKSVTFDGQGSNVTEVLGVIRRLEIIDATSGLTLWSEAINQNSSTSPTNYSFKYDFTPYFSEASARDFTIVAYDAEGNVKRRTITVTAVDVTCTSVQTLNYTTGSVLEVGGSTKNLLMYKFANNVSKLGVKVTTEMFYNGEWKKLGESNITDSYSHSISIDPCNVFGGNERLAHGSYAIRISGEDVASGVKGNVIYSSIMCVDSKSTQPIVSIRYNDINNGTIRLYDNLEVEVAAYTPGKTSTAASVYIDGVEVISTDIGTSQTEIVRKQIQGYDTDGTDTISFYAKSGNSQTNPITVTVVGSAISAIIKEGALFGLDFASRSNAETDHTISNNGYTMQVNGSNWSSNGFVKYLDEMSLRIAENVTAKIPYAPFGTAATERTNGMAFQFAFATNNIKDDEAKLMECYDPDSGAGFYVCGNKVVLFCKNGTPSTITRPFKCGEKHTVAIVVEPSTITVKRGSTDYSTIKLYFDGEEAGAIGYIANSDAILNQKQIDFNGTDGDFYLYYTLAYDSYYEWAQAFQNYLCKLTNTDEMIKEFTDEDVLDNQNRPSMDKFKEKGIPYYVVVAPQATFDTFDGDIDTSTKFECTLFYFDPTRPWRSFKAEHVQWRRQGTTSAKRPIKNDRFYLRKNKGWKITPLNPDYTNEDALKTYELFEIGYIRIGLNTIPVSIITVKVDYSDSSMANDCGVCDMMNATFRALGSDYITPAQRAFDGTWSKSDVTVTGMQMNHSTANHPIAAFRATNDSLSDAWFHARGNWKEDKGEQVALGFKDTPGYNLGCKNYGDFVEFFGKATFNAAGKFVSQESLIEIMARFKTTEGLDTNKLYLLSQYCGRDYVFMRYSGGEWARSNGSMKQVNGKWVIQGDVLNPVSGFELITYDAMDWFMGVGSIDDMMAPVATQSSWVSKLNLGQPTYPAWTQYFECMIDDDQLQEDLAMGRKVPYELFNVLKFCDSCDYSKAALATTWKNLWKQNAWKYMSIQSLIAYYTFTDYLAAVDQQAKNMQPMFFLEDGCWVENGVYHTPSAMEPVRMYFNKVYDCDTCNGKDNDGGNTIPAELDPAEDDKCYAGRGSILWNNLRRCDNQEMVADANGNTLTLPGVVATMRNLPEIDGIGAGPFSPKGALYYFVQKRILFWPKVVCTYDCESKYIRYSEKYTDIYYYALHGSGRQALPRFIEQRWRIRDGYYQTGDFKDASHVLGGRIGAKTGAVIKFRAGKSGYYGIGNDGGNVTQGMYLKAGEYGTFTNFQHGDNILLYIYQADQMSEIDLSQISLDPNFQFSMMKLAEKIVIGSTNHRQSWRLSPGNTGFLTNMNLGDLPFLTHLDVRTTEVTSINASRCPRMKTVLASGSDLTGISLAETSPIDTLELPASMTELNFVNLPYLTYPGGLTIAGMSSVNRLMLAGCPNIDPYNLINGIVGSSNLRYLRLPDVNITAPSSILKSLRTSGAIGLDPTGSAYEESNQCSGVTGRWIMEDLIDDNELDKARPGSLAAYFPQLTLYNSQYSCVRFDDTDDDCQNITNLDNGTSKEEYEPSGHFVKIFDAAHPYRCTYDSRESKLLARQIMDTNYNLMADGTEYDPTDQAGEGFDVMLGFGQYWYKGVNDFKNQQKYLFACSFASQPLSTAMKTNREKLADILVKAYSCVYTTNNGTALSKGDDYEIVDNANMNVYELDVEGMKQVRWPGLNNAQIGAVFVDENDKVVGTFNMAVSHSLFDFTYGDYVFCDVPSGAKKIIFTSPTGFDDLEAIAVDSAAVEAIEPDWVWVPMRFVGIYGMSVDALMRPRSISGVKTRTGTGTSVTNADWKYDNEGNITNTSVPTSTMNYTYADILNLIEMRGKGFHGISYEISKDIANLVMALTGTRDIQAYAGYGCGSQYATGQNNFNTYGKVTRKYSGSNIGNIIFGIQNFVGCNWEVMDLIAANVPSFAQFKKDKRIATSSYPIDAKYHVVRNYLTKEESVIQGLNLSGYCIGRVKFGRYCDIIASRLTTDNSKWNKNYSDCQWYTHDRGRCVGRSSSNAGAYGGLVYSHAYDASSSSGAHSSSRLAFSGNYEIVETAESVAS